MLVDAAAAQGLDVVCNVSGMLKWGPSQDFSLDDFERILKINTTSVFAMCQAAYPHLLKSKGCVINTASTAALQGIAYTIAYSASKHGVAAITKGLAVEWASKGIRVNAVCPGPIKTASYDRVTGGDDHMYDDGVPMHRIGQPREISHAVLWLLSSQSSYVTGGFIPVDGGMSAN